MLISEFLYKVLPLVCMTVIIVYGLSLFSKRPREKKPLMNNYRKEEEDLKSMRRLSLTQPLSEVTRPTSFEEIIGQEKGLLALKAAICSSNPQHVIIYGEPGIGKTAAARTALDLAKSIQTSPFGQEAKFVEVDGTTLRFDERGIADPLIGSVHDPIYQGAGAYGKAGIPHPKMGAVSKAHGGILFIDEIGELHKRQMNKLLKVLEDRKVFLESAYYFPNNEHIPAYIHDIFQNGLPADFRLVGATTRPPSDIPLALRSRCMEIFFDPLGEEDLKKIATNALNKARLRPREDVAGLIGKTARNGREAVNMIQTARSIADLDKRQDITLEDVQWVIETGQSSL